MIAINVSTGILTARALGAEGRGEFAALGVGAALFAGAPDAGPAQLGRVQLPAVHPEERPRLLAAALVAGAGAGGRRGGGLGVAVIPFWLHDFSPTVDSSGPSC